MRRNNSFDDMEEEEEENIHHVKPRNKSKAQDSLQQTGIKIKKNNYQPLSDYLQAL